MTSRAAVLILALAAAGCASGPQIDAAASRDLRERGDEAYEKKDYQGAIEYYTSSIERNPEYAEAYYWRGNALSRLPEQDTKTNTRESLMRAAADYSVAIAKNPAHYDAYWNRAVIAAYFKQFHSAVKDFLQCSQIRPTDPEAHLRIGELYETRFENMGPRAMEHYEKYVRLGGTEPGVVEKVKAWQSIKAQMQPPPQKGPTPQEEEKAQARHGEAMALLRQGKRAEAWAMLDDLLSQFGHTRYVRDRVDALSALHAALKPAEKK